MGRCPICLCNVLFGWFSEGLQMRERVGESYVNVFGRSGCSRRSSLYKMACRARLPRRKNKLEGSDLRSRSRSFQWCGSHSKKYDSRIPVFPVWKNRKKVLYRSAGNRIPVAGLFYITFFGYEYSTRI